MLAAYPSAMAHVHFRWDANVYSPLACPITATPAAEPIDNIEPPTPAVKVTNNHWYKSMSGEIANTANIIGMLSKIAERTPTRILALVTPKSPYIQFEPIVRYPRAPSPPTHKIIP